MRTAALLLVAGFALTGCATGTAYDTYDLNADACLDREEMIEARLADRNWTVDGTGLISDVNFDRDLDYYGVFDAYDADNDGFIEADELGAWGTDLGDYEPWDLDEDNRIRTGEFYDGLYAAWDMDGDGMIDVDEANAGYFAMWDTDADLCWDVNEYESSLVGVDFAT